MSRLILALCAALSVGATCPPNPPAPVPPDADAAPAPPVVVDAAPMPSDAGTACQVACANLTRLCHPQASDCADTLQKVNDHSTIRTPCAQTLCPALTCAALVAARTPADVRALVPPGQQFSCP